MNFDFYMYPWTDAEKRDFDCYSKIKLLAIASAWDNENAKEKYKLLVYGKRKVKNETPIKPEYPNLIKKELEYLDAVDVTKPTVNLLGLPPFSFFLQFAFTLAKPYLSKDDYQFYPCENPIRKDKVFKVPMVSESTWKGNLRWTARQINRLNPDKPDSDVIKRLFGNEKGEEKNFRQGRLHFYPTFFEQISLEVINPHDRKTKAGTIPIYIESVPVDASGSFSLLYIPFDLLGKPLEEVKKQVTEDIKLINEALRTMMLTYGFSAKKSSGFGIIKDEFKRDGDPEGLIQMKGKPPEKFSDFTELGQKIEQIARAISERE